MDHPVTNQSTLGPISLTFENGHTYEGRFLRLVWTLFTLKAPSTLDVTPTQRKKLSQVPFCCLLHHALLVACSVNNPVATIGFAGPNLLRFSRLVCMGPL